jgi:hypothetical protein
MYSYDPELFLPEENCEKNANSESFANFVHEI